MSELADLLQGMNIDYNPEPGEFTVGVVVLLKIVDEDGDVSLRSCSSDGLSWIDRTGMLRAAEAQELSFIGTD